MEMVMVMMMAIFSTVARLTNVTSTLKAACHCLYGAFS